MRFVNPATARLALFHRPLRSSLPQSRRRSVAARDARGALPAVHAANGLNVILHRDTSVPGRRA